MVDILKPVDDALIVLGIFDPLYPSWDGIPLGELNDCWEKWTLFKFDVFCTPLEFER